MKMRIEVELNGTDANPWLRYGLRQNPFPQIARAEYAAACIRLQKLGGDPIPDTDYIRTTLAGFSEEFITLCCARFRKGERVKFGVAFEEAS